MGLEAGNFLADLIETNPTGAGDAFSEGDNHLRLIKKVLKNTFPGLSGAAWRVQSKSGDYTVVSSDNMTTIRCTSSLTLNLTSAATLGNKHLFIVRAVSGATVTVDPDSTELINGGSTFTVPNETAAIISCDGSQFIAMALMSNISSGVVSFLSGSIAPSDGKILVGDGSAWVGETGSTARGSLGLGSASTRDVGVGAGGNIPDRSAADGRYGRLVASNDFTSTNHFRDLHMEITGSNRRMWWQESGTTRALVYWDDANNRLEMRAYNAAGSAPVARISVGQNGNVEIHGNILFNGASGQVNIQTFSSTGTWNKPSGATMCLLRAIGAGGGGAVQGGNLGGGGGGGGAYAERWVPAASLAGSFTVTIGDGGVGRSGGGGAQSGGNGGATTVHTHLGADGGGGGTPNASGGDAGLARAGYTTDGVGGAADTAGKGGVFGGGGGGGGAGNPGADGGKAIHGGGGGGSGAQSAGNRGAGGVSRYAGNGGNGAPGGDSAQGGSAPGGGGGGSENGNSGPGARGWAQVISFF